MAFRRQVALFIRETEASVDDLSLALGVTANTVRSWLAALGDRKAEEGAEMRKFAASPILSSPTPAAPEVQQTAEREPE